MTFNSVLLPLTALLFTVVFAGAAAYYLGGAGALPAWFFKTRLLPSPMWPVSPGRQAVGLVVSLVLIGLAQRAVVANLDLGPRFSPCSFLANSSLHLRGRGT